MIEGTIFAEGLDQTAANHVALSPLSFLARAAEVRPDHISVIHGDRRFTWSETHQRCRRFADALVKRGIGRGSVVATMLPNITAMYEANFGVPMCGAVLNALNTRLDAAAIAFALEHSETRLLLVDPEYAATITEALALLDQPPQLIVVEDPEHPVAHDLVCQEYEEFLLTGDPQASFDLPDNEWSPIALNYTSGTTGNPKGVVYTHRGAYLNALCNIVSWGMGPSPVYLWTLPMFHASGWCFPWTMAAAAGTNVCLRRIDPVKIFELIERHQVTHFCAAPIVHSMLVAEQEANPRQLGHPVKALIAGAPPPPSVIAGMNSMGVEITHVYGLTETYGPCTYCLQKPEWNELPTYDRAALISRQGVRYHMQEALEVMDPETMTPVPWDGETAGEVFLRGNLMMAGYLKNPATTAEAFAGGWLHTGDIAVRHPDGYIAITDRAKDIIISGGENISSIEVEEALYRHPEVMYAAVVAMADPYWGEVPCAFIETKTPGKLSEEELIAHSRKFLAGYKRPKKVVFTELPKTSTGKIQKFVLRTWARDLATPEAPADTSGE